MREKITPATIAKLFAMAGLVLAVTINVASASNSTESPGTPARLGPQQQVRLAEAVALNKPRYVKKTHVPHKAQRGPGTTWLNPQPEPPMGPAKVHQGDTWLNPQPEPPRPVTHIKKLHY